jgi:hypothetical protein
MTNYSRHYSRFAHRSSAWNFACNASENSKRANVEQGSSAGGFWCCFRAHYLAEPRALSRLMLEKFHAHSTIIKHVGADNKVTYLHPAPLCMSQGINETWRRCYKKHSQISHRRIGSRGDLLLFLIKLRINYS